MPGLFRQVSWGSPKGASVLSQFPSQSSWRPGWYGIALHRVIGGGVARNEGDEKPCCIEGNYCLI